jgi:hypothetical protein
VIGKLENNMELEHILVLKEIKNLDYGKMGKKLSG